MKPVFRALIPLVAAAVMAQSPASAQVHQHSGAALITGGGNIYPGIPPVPTSPASLLLWLLAQPCPLAGCSANSNSVNFQGTFTGLFQYTQAPLPTGIAVAAVIGSCSFSGSGLDSTTMAFGTVSGSCMGVGPVSQATVVCPVNSLSYMRIGNWVTVDGYCPLSLPNNVVVVPPPGHTAHPWFRVSGGFQFIPTSAPFAPVTSFALAGAATGSG